MFTSGGNCVIDPNGDKGGIWISGYQFAEDRAALRKNNIKAVVSAADLGIKFEQDVKNICFKLDDCESQEIISTFQKCYDFIQENISKANILVHCAAGISRSSALLCSYMMRKYKLTFNQALKKIRARRSIVCPNQGFAKQLQQAQAALLKKK